MNNARKFTLTTLFSALLLCGLAGCDRQSKEPTTAASSLSEDQKETQTISYYVEIGNQLNNITGLEYAASNYIRQNIDKGDGKGSYSLTIVPVNYNYIMEQYANAEGLNYQGNPELTQAAADLKKKLEVLHNEQQQLGQYYETAEYKMDNLAKGKSADARIKDELEQALQSYADFQTKLSVVYHQNQDKQLEAMKKNGQMYAYHQLKSLNLAEELVSLIQSEADLQDKNKVAHADAIAKEIQDNLASLQKLIDQDPNANKPGVPKNSVISYLYSELKYYREFKDSKDPSDHRFMIDGYNDAVNSYNN
ncbi:YiiG family protein [Brenneria izadpanahii]|uniref:YiiG family protein n=1 Tax=Brenneria izadpanahii TaxID=2722756 RepID=A0ABX7UWD5_9GAMM|nr:DUF3829 domain-containing protein [Brenneria izadpanahii]QTF09181.1 YiiG family protein [Brenneria izadpanahii]